MLTFKKWKLQDTLSYSQLCSKYNITPLSAKVAASRIENLGEKELFSESDSVSSPFELIDMDAAVERINEAVDSQQKIVVYGDYDADGVTATVILTSYLEAMGADVSYYIPQRESEGYGLNKDAIQKLSQDGCELIVTVDNGISAVEEIDFAQSLGMDVVVTDHHMPQSEIPDCIVIDPHRRDCPSRFKEICGAFVAFKLVAALDGGEYDGAFEQYAELVALATIADVVPLVDENRTIVRFGIERMRETDNFGLKALIDASLSESGQIDSNSVTYSLVPRINAAGRMGNAQRAAQLLLCEDEEESEALAEQLCRENSSRKDIETDILNEIDEMQRLNPQLFSNRIVVVSGKNWHHGVLGIVASKLVERTGKPSLVLSEQDGNLSGSARSVEGFDLFSALEACKECFTRFGGHSLAAGVTLLVDKLPEFINKINDYACKNHHFMPQNEIEIDAVISAEEISLAAVKELSLFEPFGKSNPAPIFALLSLKVKSITSIGNGNHSRLTLSDGKNTFTALYFGMPEGELTPFLEKNVDIIVRLKQNNFNGNLSVTIQIVDLRPCGVDDRLFFKEKQLYEAAARGEALNKKEAEYLMPSYDEAAELYRILKQNSGYGRGEDMLWWQLSGKINRARLSVILKALCQSELLKCDKNGYSIVPANSKHNLFETDILKFIAGYLQ